MPEPRYRLYGFPRWGSLAPQLVLEELGVPYEMVWMERQQLKEPAWRAISPLGFVPALRLPDGRAIVESSAIVMHLTNAHPEGRLAPPVGSGDHAVYLQWLTFLNAEVYATINCYEHFLDDDAEGGGGPALRKAEAKVTELFGVLERVLAEGGPWLLGERYSAADPYLYMLTLWHRPSSAALYERYPRIAALCAAVRARPRLRPALEANGL